MAKEFDPKVDDFEVVDEIDVSSISDPKEQIKVVQRALQVADVPASMARAGIYGALSEDSSALGEMGEQWGRIKAGGLAAEEDIPGPRGEDIVAEMGLENPTAQKVAGFATEMVTDPLSYGPGAVSKFTKFLKPIEKKIRSGAQKTLARSLSDYVTTSKYAKEGVDPQILASRMIEEDLVQHINNPSKLLEVIHGPKKITSDDILRGGAKSIKKVPKGRGMVSEISDDLERHIRDISSYSKQISNKRISMPIELERINQALSKVSGVPYNKASEMADKKFLKSVIGGYKDSMSLSDAYTLKKNIGKQLRTREFYKGTDEAMAHKKELLLGLNRRLDEIIKEELKGVPVQIGDVVEDAATYYAVQNNRMHQLLQLGGILETVPLKELKNVDLKQLLASGVLSGTVGVGMGSAFGAPVSTGLGAAIAGTAAMARKSGGDIIDPLMAKGWDVASKVAVPISGPIATQAGREMQDEPLEVNLPWEERKRIFQNRGPQSVMDPMERMTFNMPKKLIETRLPRTTEGVQQNAKIFKLKFAQEAEGIVKKEMMAQGIDPEMMDEMEIQERATEMYKDLSHVLDNRPEEIGAMLPAWITMFPHMFEKDRYNRIDGVVPASMQPMVREEIRKNQNISNTERIKKLDLLNRSGEYKDQ